jgi:hypothetical protein
MDDSVVVRSSEVDPDSLEQLLADHIADEQVREFRRYLLTRLAVIVAAAWLLAWPVHVLPHTVLWGLLATAAMVIGLMSPLRNRRPTPDTPPTRRH